MIRETSIEAYKKVIESGLVNRKSIEVYKTFYDYGPLTSAECYNKLPWIGSDQRGNIRARVFELSKMGLLQELGKRKCSITGRTVILWDVTSCLPIKFEKEVRIKCHHCEGRGYVIEQQARFFGDL